MVARHKVLGSKQPQTTPALNANPSTDLITSPPSPRTMAKRKATTTDSPENTHGIAPKKKARLDESQHTPETVLNNQTQPETTDNGPERSKTKGQPQAGPSKPPTSISNASERKMGQPSVKPTTSGTSKRIVRKLAPSRPFPVVPTSVSATGPKSAHHEGKNLICVTRKTSLAAYLRKCKQLVMEDGYKTLHLSALGAAIPLLATLSVSLSAILPFPEDEIHIEVKTGTVDLVDEIIPENEAEEISTNTREKSSMSVVVRIGDDGGSRQVRKSATSIKRGKRRKVHTKAAATSTTGGTAPAQVVLQEQEQEHMDF